DSRAAGTGPVPPPGRQPRRRHGTRAPAGQALAPAGTGPVPPPGRQPRRRHRTRAPAGQTAAPQARDPCPRRADSRAAGTGPAPPPGRHPCRSPPHPPGWHPAPHHSPIHVVCLISAYCRIMPTPYGSRGGMAFGAEELRVLRRALALALHPAAASADDVQDCLRLADAVDEATRESARLRAFLVADLGRYRAALPG